MYCSTEADLKYTVILSSIHLRRLLGIFLKVIADFSVELHAI